MMQKALASVDDDSVAKKHTQRIAAQLYYLKLRQNMVKSAADGTLQQLKTILKNDPTIVAEHGVTLESLLKTHYYY